jgi:hypothetical protein
MLTLNPQPTFVAPALITVPGQAEPVSISVTWRHKSRTELDAWLKGLSSRDDHEVLSEVIAGWDEADVDSPYSVDALCALLNNYPRAAMDLMAAYSRALYEGRAKN